MEKDSAIEKTECSGTGSDRVRDQELVSHLATAVKSYPAKATEAPAEAVQQYDGDKVATDENVNMDSMLVKFKGLALNKEIHPVMTKDPVICPLLVLLLDSESTDYVLQSLKILHLLAINPANRHDLGKVLHFYDGLRAVAGNSKKFPKEVRDFAQLIHDMTKDQRPVLKARTVTNRTNHAASTAEPVDKSKKPACDTPANGKRNPNQSVNKGKCVELYVPLCIFKDKRLRMTEALLKLNGIISITYDMKKCYCLVRVKSYVPNEVLGKTIANLGFECHIVTKVDNREVMLKMEPDPKLENSISFHDKENVGGRKSPQYLSDSDSENSFQEPQAVANVEETNEGQKDKKGWLSTAAGFFQKTLYW